MTFPYSGRARISQCAIGWAAACLVALLVALVPAVALAQDPGERRTVLVMGDSLSAAYGLATDEGWVALTADRIAARAPGWRVVNASISGETTAGGRARIVDALDRHRPALVVIALGANDGLRGLPVDAMRRNLAYMIGAAHGARAEVLLVGMQMPPNLGPDYTRAFAASYPLLAERFGTALVPFLLEPVARDRDHFQADNLHPVAAVQDEIRDHVWTVLAPLLE
ncbi:MAG TPA: arylesterase [Xanthomonadaceae bacterium]|nr:arylesterase [Xanthomonadaceae bacterium]